MRNFLILLVFTLATTLSARNYRLSEPTFVNKNDESIFMAVKQPDGTVIEKFLLNNGNVVSKDSLEKMIAQKFLALVNQYRANPESFDQKLLAIGDYIYHTFGDSSKLHLIRPVVARHMRPWDNSLIELPILNLASKKNTDTIATYSVDYAKEHHHQIAHLDYANRRSLMERDVIAKTGKQIAEKPTLAGSEITQVSCPLERIGNGVDIEKTALEILFTFLISQDGHREVVEANYNFGSYFGAGVSLKTQDTGHWQGQVYVSLVANFVGVK